MASIERQPATVLIFYVSKFAQRAPPWKEGGIEDGALCLGPAFQNSPRILVSIQNAPEEKASKIIMVN